MNKIFKALREELALRIFCRYHNESVKKSENKYLNSVLGILEEIQNQWSWCRTGEKGKSW